MAKKDSKVQLEYEIGDGEVVVRATDHAFAVSATTRITLYSEYADDPVWMIHGGGPPVEHGDPAKALRDAQKKVKKKLGLLREMRKAVEDAGK